MGDQWVSFTDPQGAYELTDLPQFPGGYQGAIAQRTQLARLDDNGDLLFFIVDGTIYDGDGALIADNELVSECQECVPRGCTKVLALPVPTGDGGARCGLYYIVTTRPSIVASQAKVVVGLLDMNAPNRYVQGRRGRMVNLVSDLDDPDYGQFWNFFNDPDVVLGNISEYLIELPATVQGQKGGWIELAAIDPRWISGDHIGSWLLHVTHADRITQYYVKADGIWEHWTLDVGTNSPGADHWAHQSQFGYSRFSGECYFAATQDGSWEVPNAIPSVQYPLIVLRLAANTGDIAANTGYSLDVEAQQNQYVYGCAFDQQSFRLFYTRTGAGVHLGVLDLVGGTWTDLEGYTNLGITGAEDRVYTHIEPNVPSAGGSPSTLLYAHANGLSALNVPNALDPSTWTWQSSVPFTQPLNVVPLSVNDWSGTNPPRLLNGQMINDPLSTPQPGRCCAYTALIDAPQGDLEVSGTSNYWSPGDNGLPGDPAEGEFQQDLVVLPGASLVVQNMTLRFGPDARIVVRPGGYARFTNCTLTSANCEGARWKGIRVEGTTSQDQLPVVHGDQGYLLLVNTAVVNAELGVVAAREIVGGFDVGGYGGIVQCTGAHFRNCLRGARITDYHANVENGVENNRSRFTNTRFTIDGGWPGGTPRWQLILRNTNGVDVTNCGFANDAPQLFTEGAQGNGLLMANAQTNVVGDDNPANSFVRGWNLGALSVLNFLTPVTVKKMHFSGNATALADYGGLFGQYTFNTFTVPDQGTGATPRVGMLLWQTQLMTVERNLFQGQDAAPGLDENSVGIFHLGLNASLAGQNDNDWLYVDNRIYDNEFKDLTVGNLVQWVNRGAQANNDAQGLQLLCGDYTNNQFDHAVVEGSLIRPRQGSQDNPITGPAGNRYFDQANCDTEYDWWLDPQWNVVPGWLPGMTVTYYHHEQPVAIIDPLCASPNFDDQQVLFSGTFAKPTSCGDGILDMTGGINELEVDLDEATVGWVATKTIYDGLVGAQDEPTILAAITEQNAPWTSSALRNLLLASSPVSDLVLLETIKRFEPLDSWHLTQVLVQNSPLNRGVMEVVRVESGLSPFYLGIVEQAQQGQGPSAKQLLEEEMGRLHGQRATLLAGLGWYYGTDSLLATGMDSLRAKVLNDPDPAFGYGRMNGLFTEGDWGAMLTMLQGPLAKVNGVGVYNGLRLAGLECAGAWDTLGLAFAQQLAAVQVEGRMGAPLASGVLWSTDRTDFVPPVELPRLLRQRLEFEQLTQMSDQNTVVAAYPNPASDQVMVVLPGVASGTPYVLFDATGRTVHRGRVDMNGLHELAVKALPNGLYDLRVLGLQQTVRINVVH
ncbi:MAG: hypothetical protein U0U25_12095 [Flavobacteriales bacterium]